MGASMNSLPQMIKLMKVHGVAMGSSCRSPNTLTNIAYNIGISMHERLTNFLKNSNDPLALIIGKFINHQNNFKEYLLYYQSFIVVSKG